MIYKVNFDLKFPAALHLDKAENFTLIENVIAGSEKFGIRSTFAQCSEENPEARIRDNEIHAALFGIYHKVRLPGSVR